MTNHIHHQFSSTNNNATLSDLQLLTTTHNNHIFADLLAHDIDDYSPLPHAIEYGN